MRLFPKRIKEFGMKNICDCGALILGSRQEKRGDHLIFPRRSRKCPVPFSLSLFMFWSSICLGSQADFATQIKALQAKTIPQAYVGIMVMEADTGKIIFNQNGDGYFCPASNTKLFTVVSALKYLGADYQFSTNLRFDPEKIKAGALNGDVTLEFRGDPSFEVKDLRFLLSSLKKYKIKKIVGNLIIDNMRFSPPYYAPGWTINSQNWYYSAPVRSVIINQNLVKFSVTPSPTLGGKVSFTQLSEDLPAILVKQDVTTVTESEADTQCSLLLAVNNNEIQLGGCWPKTGGAKTVKIALDNPDGLAKKLVQSILKEEGVRLSGDILFEKNTLLKIQETHTSLPLKELLGPLLKDSNNLYAESILKTLGYEKYQKGSFQMGVLAVQDILQKDLGLNFTKLYLSDGSGASRYNLISPRQVAELLLVIYKHLEIRENIMDALPVYDKEGEGFRAKTGTADGISALSGYIKVKDKTFIVAILINETIHDQAALQKFEHSVFDRVRSL